jgi:hypothetical protein
MQSLVSPGIRLTDKASGGFGWQTHNMEIWVQNTLRFTDARYCQPTLSFVARYKENPNASHCAKWDRGATISEERANRAIPCSPRAHSRNRRPPSRVWSGHVDVGPDYITCLFIYHYSNSTCSLLVKLPSSYSERCDIGACALHLGRQGTGR